MNNKTRSLIAITVFASHFLFVEATVADVTADAHKASVNAKLSEVGFLDFKTLLFSPGSGENLDSVFNQIKFIGPETFSRHSLKHESLDDFKSGKDTYVPAGPAWSWGDLDKELRDLGVVGKPLPASTGLVDAILTDLKNSISNNGVTAPTIGRKTSAFFNAATQDIIRKIDRIERSGTIDRPNSQTSPQYGPPSRIPHYLAASLLGLSLIGIGFWRRRPRRQKSAAVRIVAPSACIEIIEKSPIRYTAKSV